MKENIHKVDRVVRVALAVLAIDIPIGGLVAGPMVYFFYIIAAFLLITALIGFSPAYYLFGISTKKEKK